MRIPILVPFAYHSSSITFLNYSLLYSKTHCRSQLLIHWTYVIEKNHLKKSQGNKECISLQQFLPAFKNFSYSQSIWKFPHTTGLFCFVQVWIWPNTKSHSLCELRPVIFLVTNRVSKQMNFLLPNLFYHWLIEEQNLSLPAGLPGSCKEHTRKVPAIILPAQSFLCENFHYLNSFIYRYHKSHMWILKRYLWIFKPELQKTLRRELVLICIFHDWY